MVPRLELIFKLFAATSRLDLINLNTTSVQAQLQRHLVGQ